MRSIRLALAALAISVLTAVPAMAGGWAVTTFDSLPPEFRAGETYTLGYTIRQHGVTPINVERTEIRITSPQGGKTLRFAGVQEGAIGHYVAKVTFPYEGRWAWEVSQGPFEAQALGTTNVLPAALGETVTPAAQAAPAPASAPQPAQPNGLLLGALVLASAGAAILFGSRIATVMRRRAAQA